jgi:hypothetical protein
MTLSRPTTLHLGLGGSSLTISAPNSCMWWRSGRSWKMLKRENGTMASFERGGKPGQLWCFHRWFTMHLFFWEIMLFAMDLRLASCLFSYRRRAMYLTHPRAMRYSMSIQTNCFRMARVIQCWDFCLPRVGVPASAVLSHSVVTGLGLATGEPSLRRWASRQSALPATWKSPTLGHMESADWSGALATDKIWSSKVGADFV